MKTLKEKRRAAWMTVAEEIILKQLPDHAGHIVWADLQHLYLSGSTPMAAAVKYIDTYKEVQP